MYGELYARWAVPAVPTGSYSGYDVYYAFPGLRTYAFINQPVIQYGYNGIVGGNFWGMATWHCDGGNYTCLHSTLDTVYAGDSIAGRVQTRFDCPHSPCHWYLQMSDLTRDTWTGFDYDDSQADTVDYYEAVGGAVEVKNLTSCNQYPSTGVFFNSISLYDASGNKQSHVNWQKTIDSTAISPICGFGVTFTDSTVNLYHNPPPPPPPFSVTINGQSLVPARHQCTWYAMPANGTAPYTYSWTVNGTAAGNGSDSLTITTPTRAFTIGVQATDANNNQASNTLPVSIGGSSCES